jgi:predicted nucleic acid-binding protein
LTDAPTFVWLLTEHICRSTSRGAREAARSIGTEDVSLIREQGQFVRVSKKVSDIPDPDDAAFCEWAESAYADFIVTLNPDDFPQNKLKTKVIAPSDPSRQEDGSRGLAAGLL